MANYRQYLKKISGDTLIIVVAPPMIPLKGITSIVDWRLNSLLSKLILDESYTGDDGSVLLLCSKEKMPIERVILVGFDNKLSSRLLKITKGLHSKNFSLSYDEKLDESVKNLISYFKNNGINWTNSGFHKFNNENIITFTGVDYGQ